MSCFTVKVLNVGDSVFLRLLLSFETVFSSYNHEDILPFLDDAFVSKLEILPHCLILIGFRNGDFGMKKLSLYKLVGPLQENKYTIQDILHQVFK